MAVPGFNEATLSDEAASALRMIRGFSLHSHERLFHKLETSDVRDQVHFRQTKDHVPCIVCGRDHAKGEGLWHRFDLLTGDLIN